MEPLGAVAALVFEFEADRRGIETVFDAPYSRVRRERLGLLLDMWKARVEGLSWDDLSPAECADAALLDIHLDGERAQLDADAGRFSEVASLCPFAEDMVSLLDQRRLLEDLEPSFAADRLDRARQNADALAREAETEAPASRGVVLRSARLLRDLKKALDDWYAFYCGYDPAFTWWTKQPYEALGKSLEACAEALDKSVRGGDPSAIVGDPVGRETLMAALDVALTPYTPEELIAIGEREARWCRDEMLRAAQDMGVGDDWRAAMERVKEDHVPPGEQTRLVRDLAREAIAFVEERDLITVPELARDGWRMEMMSPERQKVNPFFLGGECIIVSYPTADMEHHDKLMSMRGNNRHFSRATVHHELIPGHFLQHFSQQRYRPHRRIFDTPFWTEGWSLYWEMRLWDLGFPRTPEERLGMLFWRMHRAARVVFSLRFHLGEMTARECVEMLVNEVGHERATAEGEVRRSFESDYPPLYQCAYLIGGLQIRALQHELVGRGPWTERQFHDAFLRENCMPIAMIRAILRGDPIPKGFRPVWHFDAGFAD